MICEKVKYWQLYSSLRILHQKEIRQKSGYAANFTVIEMVSGHGERREGGGVEPHVITIALIVGDIGVRSRDVLGGLPRIPQKPHSLYMVGPSLTQSVRLAYSTGTITQREGGREQKRGKKPRPRDTEKSVDLRLVQ